MVEMVVSMPFWAFLHFYEERIMKYYEEIVCVNALLGFPSFLQQRSNCEKEETKCVNALLGFPSFLRYEMVGDDYAYRSCVNALLGFPSFLQHPSGTRRNKAFSRPFLRVFI